MKKLFTFLFIVSFMSSFAQVTQQQLDAFKGTATGTNSYSVTINSVTASAPYDGQKVWVKFANTNTTPPTLKVNAYTAFEIYLNGAALSAGDIPVNQYVEFIYYAAGSKWQMQKVGISGTGFVLPTAITTTITPTDTLLFKHEGTWRNITRNNLDNVVGNLTYTVTGNETSTITGTRTNTANIQDINSKADYSKGWLWLDQSTAQLAFALTGGAQIDLRAGFGSLSINTAGGGGKIFVDDVLTSITRDGDFGISIANAGLKTSQTFSVTTPNTIFAGDVKITSTDIGGASNFTFGGTHSVTATGLHTIASPSLTITGSAYTSGIESIRFPARALFNSSGITTLNWETSTLSGTWALGTPSSVTLTNATGLPIITGTTGTLSVARGGTGLTTFGGTDRVLYTSTADNITSSSNLLFDGTKLGIGMTPVNILDVTQNQNAASAIKILNNNVGTAAATLLQVNNGTANGYLVVRGTGFTTNGMLVANGVEFFGDNAAGVSLIASNASGIIKFGTGGFAAANERARFLSGGQFGIGVTAPTAMLHLKAGTATASTAPLKFNSGTNLTTAEAGAVEYNGTNLFFTRTGTTRENVITTSAVNSVSPTAPNRTITVVIDGTTYYIHAKTTND